MAPTIDMVTCPYCENEWIRGDTEVVCSTCEPSLTTDLAVGGIVDGVNRLRQLTTDQIEQRFDLLSSTYQSFGEILKKVKSEEG
jgi:hypothetical protein